MDQRMNGYDGYQSFYQDSGYSYGQPQGYSMDYQNGGYGYDQPQGYSMDHQSGSFGYGEQQGYSLDNQGGYHHQQWNNNHQDPCSSFNEQQALEEIQKLTREMHEIMDKLIEEQRKMDEGVLSVVDEVLEPPKEEEMIPSSSMSQATLEAHCEVTNQSHMDGPKLEENERFLDEFAKRLESPDDVGCAHDEGCAKDDPNEQTSNTWAKPMYNRSTIKESLQALVGSEDSRRFHSKLGHLQVILDSKEILEDVLQELKREHIDLHLRVMYEKARRVKEKETIRSMDEPQVENVVKATNVISQPVLSVVGAMEKPEPSKHAKRKRRKRRKKPKKTKDKGIAPKPPLLTFTPLRFVDGKLECKVSSKSGHKPFSKVRILLSPGSKGDDWSAINEAMAKTFRMKLGDRGPLSKPKVPNG